MIGFPAIGFEFQKNPSIIKFGDNFALTWYGLILAAGFLIALIYCLRQTKHFGLKQDELIDVLFFAVPAAIVGARLYYVAFNWETYKDDPISILYTWKGGIAIHGAIIGAAAAAALFCWVRHISIGAMLDIGAMGLLIGQAIGRWGNFVNGEVYGTATELPWRMRVYGQEVHPLFLYESLWNILGLVLLWFLMKKRKYNGQMFTVYIAWYGLGRALLEGMRMSEFQMMLGSWMVSQAMAILSCIVALVLLFYMTILKKHEPILAWTAGRDEYEEYRKSRRRGAAEDAEEVTEDEKALENGKNEESEADEDGGDHGRESAGEGDQE